MIRTIVTELILLSIPFAVYAAYLWGTRAGLLHPESWSLRRVALLSIAALVCAIAGFLLFADFEGAAPGSTYIPAHVEDGALVPGVTTSGKTSKTSETK